MQNLNKNQIQIEKSTLPLTARGQKYHSDGFKNKPLKHDMTEIKVYWN
jgi:hypothetical protein